MYLILLIQQWQHLKWRRLLQVNSAVFSDQKVVNYAKFCSISSTQRIFYVIEKLFEVIRLL